MTIALFLIIALVLMFFGWPLLPGAIKHSQQDKRRAAYQKKIKDERVKREQERSEEE